MLLFFYRIVGNLKISAKLLLIVLPMLLALLGLFTAFITKQSSLIETTQQELEGTEHYLELLKLMESIQRHRGLSQILIKGDSSVQDKLGAEATAINELLNRLPKQFPAQWSQSPKTLQEIDQKWRELQQQAQSNTAPESFAKHSQAIELNIQMLRDMADDSTMTFDPEVATYYLISAIAFELPYLHEQLAMVRGQLAGYATKAEADPVLMARVQQAFRSIKQYAKNLTQSYEKVTVAGVDLGPTVNERLAALNQNIVDAGKLINSLENNPAAIPGPEVFKQVSGYLNNLSKLAEISVQELQAALHTRIEREQNNIGSSFVLAAVFGMLLMGLLLLSMRKIAADTRILLDQSKRLAGHDLRKNEVLDSRDELGMVSKSIENIRCAQHKVVADMQMISQNLNHSTSNVGSASEQIVKSANEQSDASSAVASAIEELSVSVGQVSQQCSVANDLAKRTGDAGKQGLGLVKNSRATMEKIGQDSLELTQKMTALGERSESISSIINTIQEIAQQTNLLALNAAIEAARAGEQGRGFAVVADEVRKLSERTANSTKDIAELVTAIQMDTQSVIEDVSGWTDKISGSVDMSVSIEKQMQEIDVNTGSTEGAVQEINQALNEQNKTSQMIARQVETIAQMTDSAREVAESMRKVATEVNGSSTQLEKFVHMYHV